VERLTSTNEVTRESKKAMPPELERTVEEGLHAVRNSPEHHTGAARRCAVYAAFGPRDDPMPIERAAGRPKGGSEVGPASRQSTLDRY
jgi:hypothetical protein